MMMCAVHLFAFTFTSNTLSSMSLSFRCNSFNRRVDVMRHGDWLAGCRSFTSNDMRFDGSVTVTFYDLMRHRHTADDRYDFVYLFHYYVNVLASSHLLDQYKHYHHLLEHKQNFGCVMLAHHQVSNYSIIFKWAKAAVQPDTMTSNWLIAYWSSHTRDIKTYQDRTRLT